MADFCKQCSIDIFGEDFEDLSGLGYGKPLAEGAVYPVLCEGCGYINVNEKGERVK